MTIFLKKYRLFLPLIVVCGFVFFTCIQPPDYPLEPVLSLSNTPLSKTTVLQDLNGIPRDSFYITVNFTDGDGDLGFIEGDTSLFIFDTRLNAQINDARGLPQVPPQGAGNGISGNFRVRLFGGCCRGIGGCTSSSDRVRDTVVYEIYIKDRAGNTSNKVRTPPIVILCE